MSHPAGARSRRVPSAPCLRQWTRPVQGDRSPCRGGDLSAPLAEGPRAGRRVWWAVGSGAAGPEAVSAASLPSCLPFHPEAAQLLRVCPPATLATGQFPACLPAPRGTGSFSQGSPRQPEPDGAEPAPRPMPDGRCAGPQFPHPIRVGKGGLELRASAGEWLGWPSTGAPCSEPVPTSPSAPSPAQPGGRWGPRSHSPSRAPGVPLLAPPQVGDPARIREPLEEQ